MPKSHLTSVKSNSKTSYLSHLFSGRLNRTGFFIGSIAILLITTLVGTATVTLLGIAFSGITRESLTLHFILIYIITTFYNISLALRRLHDLNKNGLLLIFYLPGMILSFFSFIGGFLGQNHPASDFLLHPIPTSYEIISQLINWSSYVLTLYLLLWPGSTKANSFGSGTSYWRVKEVLGFPTKKSTPVTIKSIAKYLFKMAGIVILTFIVIVILALIVGSLRGLR